MFRLISCVSPLRANSIEANSIEANSIEANSNAGIQINKIKNTSTIPHTFCSGMRHGAAKHIISKFISENIAIYEKDIIANTIRSLNLNENTLTIITLNGIHSSLMLKHGEENFTYVSIPNETMKNITFNKLINSIRRDQMSYSHLLKPRDFVSIDNLDLSNTLNDIDRIRESPFRCFTNNCSKFTCEILKTFVYDDVKFIHDRKYQMPQNSKYLAKEIKDYLEMKSLSGK